MTPPPVRVDLLIDAARFALGRVTLRPADLRSELGVSRHTAQQLIRALADWRVLSGHNYQAARLVCILPRHQDLVIQTIAQHGGIPPAINPLDTVVHPGLTDQQRIVLDLVAEGHSNITIATLMYLTKATIKTHVRALCERLGARNRVHVVTIAHRHSLLPNPHKSMKDTQL